MPHFGITCVIPNYKTVTYEKEIMTDNRKQLAQETLNELRLRKVVLDDKVEGWLGAAGGFFTVSGVMTAFSGHQSIVSFIGLVLIAAGWLRIIYFRTKIIWIEEAAQKLNMILNNKPVSKKEWSDVFEYKDGCARKGLWKGVIACPYTAMIMGGLLIAQATLFFCLKSEITMTNSTISESNVKTFIQDWFQKLDKHPEHTELLPMVSEAIVMKMPENEFLNHEGFKQWYGGVEQYQDQSHTVKGLQIGIEGGTATVKLINRWERSDLKAKNPAERLAFYAAQTWTLQRSPQTQKLVIATYTVDYFLPEENLKL
jgi:hypothetical protein